MQNVSKHLEILRQGLLILLLVLVIPLFSYFLMLNFIPLSTEQEQVMLFLQQRRDSLEGFSLLEISHLQDVTIVMQKVETLFVVSLLLFVILWFDTTQQLRSTVLFGAGLIASGLLLFISVGILLWFDVVFRYFHLLFFPQGNWMFAADSLLIKTFPENFFVNLSLWIFGLALVLGIALMVIGLIWKRNHSIFIEKEHS